MFINLKISIHKNVYELLELIVLKKLSLENKKY